MLLQRVENYMARHINVNRCHNNCERYGRIHVYNGGPRGCTNPNTMGYWNNIVSKGCTPDSYSIFSMLFLIGFIVLHIIKIKYIYYV